VLQQFYTERINALTISVSIQGNTHILGKKFDELNKICKITNAQLLNEIVDQYNEKNKRDFNILPNDFKRYLKKYHNSV